MSASIIENLKKTFGGVPTSIEDNIPLLRKKGGNFACVSCDEVIEVEFRDKNSITKLFENHFVSENHKRNILSSDTLYDDLLGIFEKAYPLRESSLPQIVFNNLQFLKAAGQHHYICKLCGPSASKITVCYFNYPQTENNFYCHFLSKGHEDKVKIFNDECRDVKVNLEQIYGSFPPFLLSNIQVIDQREGTYFCSVCDQQLIVDFNDVKVTEDLFRAHLLSSDHKKIADQKNAFISVPKLHDIYSLLPTYILKNIEYIKYIDYSFFCTLCCENIKDGHRAFETDQHLKSHLFSSEHTRNLLSRRNPQNEIYRRLHQLFDTFPNVVQENLPWLGSKGNSFYCNLCKCKIKDQNDTHYTEKNILTHFVRGYKDPFYENQVHSDQEQKENKKHLNIVNILENIFGVLPKIVQHNIEYLKLDDYVNCKFILCDICGEKIQYSIDDHDQTELSLEEHLSGYFHKNSVNDEMKTRRCVEEALRDHLPFIPNFITQNMKHIVYKDTSALLEQTYHRSLDSIYSSDEHWSIKGKDIEEIIVAKSNFYCRLCQKVIVTGKSSGFLKVVGSDDLANKVTEFNFRTHLLSREHKIKIKNLSFLSFGLKQELKSLFGSIPDYVNNNICHLTYFENSVKFFCSLCKSYFYDKSGFKRHLTKTHEDGKNHQLKVKVLEERNERALELLDMRFWSIPEIALKNIDFLSISGSHLYCVLCQETLYIDEYDLELTESELCNHFNSKKHKSFFQLF